MRYKECKICHKLKKITDFYKPTVCTCKKCTCEKNTQKVIDRNLKAYPDIDGEIWKQMTGYEGKYMVSNLGRIRSLLNGSKFYGILKPAIHKGGYLRVRLYDNKSLLVHRLVAQTFIPNPKNKATVNHKNGNKKDNRVENLEWATQKENNRHAIRTGLHDPKKRRYSFNSKSIKISFESVSEIRKLHSQGIKSVILAKKYNVSTAQISRIINLKTRIHTKDELYNVEHN